MNIQQQQVILREEKKNLKNVKYQFRDDVLMPCPLFTFLIYA